jgi:ABC-type transport system substrate-binding protein
VSRLRYVTAFLIFSLLTSLIASCGGSITGVKSGRFEKPLVLLINGASAPTRQYAQVMQNSLRLVGIPVEIDAVEQGTLIDRQRKGQYQITTNRWVGGNQDPIFLKNLFATGDTFNRGNYSNSQLDPILNEAVNTADREKARALYVQAQEIISREVPMLPLWYTDQMVIARKNVGNIQVDMSGDWSFMGKLTAEGKTGSFVVTLESPPISFEQLRETDASSERMRQLMFNTLVKKNERFDYVGDLAADIQRAEDGLSYTFTLRDGVKFHNGNILTAQDVKYTLDTLLASGFPKSNDFFEGRGEGRQPLVASVEARDARTLVVRLRKAWPNLLSNLVPIGIIPQGSAETQRERPVGSGPFKFVRYEESQQLVDLAAHENYWGGAPAIAQLRVRSIQDTNTLQAELRSGGVDLAVVANLGADVYRALGQDPNLQVKQFPGANVVYLLFNAQDPVLKDPRVRQAISYAIDREGIVRDLLLGQARVAHSILPQESWAYTPGQTYKYDPDTARKILDEAGYK